MIRVNIVVEGQTEEAFVSQTLTPYFAERDIIIQARCVETGRKKGKIYRGGAVSYEKIRNDIIRWIREDRSAWVTTMFDLYRLPQDFPGLNGISLNSDPYDKVAKVEKAFKEDIRNTLEGNIGYIKFIPYIQLHEFESVLLVEPMKIMEYFIGEKEACENLKVMVKDFESPEHINQIPEQAPSKRIIRVIPQYEKLKTTAGPLIAEAIGINAIMQKCKHFSDWIDRICEVRDYG